MIALDSTQESITWMLSELDPKIRIDKYQVSNYRVSQTTLEILNFNLKSLECFWDILYDNTPRDFKFQHKDQELQAEASPSDPDV